MKVSLLNLIIFYSLIIMVAFIIFPLDLDLARMYVKEKKVDLATDVLKNLLSGDKKDFFAIKENADFDEMLGNINDSIDLYEKLVKTKPKEKKYLKKLAAMYEGNNMPKKATELYERVYELEPKNYVLLKRLVADYVWFKDIDKAIKYQEIYVKEKNGDIEERSQLADLYLGGERLNDAMKQYDIIENMSKEKIEWIYKKAEIYLVKKNYDSAIKEYRRIIRLDPSDFGAYKRIAEIYLWNEKFKEAFESAKIIFGKFKNNQESVNFAVETAANANEPEWSGDRKFELYRKYKKKEYINQAVKFYRWAGSLGKIITVYKDLIKNGKIEYDQYLEYLHILYDHGDIDSLLKILIKDINKEVMYDKSIRTEILDILVMKNDKETAKKYIDIMYGKSVTKKDKKEVLRLIEGFLVSIQKEHEKVKYYTGYLEKFPEDTDLRFELISYLIWIHNYIEAAHQYEILVKYDEDIKYYEELASLYIKIKQPDKSAALYRLMAKKYPEKRKEYIKIAKTLERRNMPPDKLINELEKDYIEDPSDYILADKLIKYFEKKEMKKQLINIYEIKYRNNLISEYEIIQLTELYIETNNKNKAGKLINDSYKRFNLFDNRYYAAMTFWALRDYDRAVELYSELYSEFPEDLNISDDYYNLLMETERFDKLEKVIRDLEKDFKKEPANDDIAYKLQTYYEKRKFTDRLIKYYEIKYKNNDIEEYEIIRLGELYIEEKYENKAKRIFEENFYKFKKNETKYYIASLLAELYQKADQNTEYEIMIQFKKLYKPFDIDNSFTIAGLFKKKGEVKFAEDVLDGLEVHYDEDSKSLNRIGDNYLWEGDMNNALRVFEKQLEKDPENYEVLKMTGKMLSWENSAVQALEYFKKCYRINPADYEVNYYMGEIYEVMNKKDLAFKKYIAARDLYHSAEKKLETELIYAKILWRLGEFKKAEKEYGNLYNKYPDNNDIKTDYAELLIERKNYYKAKFLLKN